MLLRVAVAVLCMLGINASAYMLRKHRLAQRGQLLEPSVVTSPRAALGGVPNARIGLLYYALLLAISPFLVPAHPLVLHAALAAAIFASAVSIFLAYSLLFVTRRPCTYCWTAHIINWTMLALLLLLSHLSA